MLDLLRVAGDAQGASRTDMDRMSQTLTVIRDRTGRVLGTLIRTSIGYHALALVAGRIVPTTAPTKDKAEAAIRAAHGEES